MGVTPLTLPAVSVPIVDKTGRLATPMYTFLRGLFLRTGGSAGTTLGFSDTSGQVVTYANLQVPTGAVIPFAGASAPAGWLLCNGVAVSRATYAGLFAVIGTRWGIGDGATTFNVPDISWAPVLGPSGGTTIYIVKT
jgi:hypothetical protein